MDAIKIVGRKPKKQYKLEEIQGFLELVISLRGAKPFIPKGVHRFKTFEESNQWSLKVMARRPNQDLLSKSTK